MKIYSGLHYRGLPLADGVLDVAFNGDGSLHRVSSATENQAPEVLTAVGSQLAAAEQALLAREQRRAGERSAERQEGLGELDASLALDEALANAGRALVTFEAAPVGSQEARLAQIELTIVRLRANDKARRAGLPPPFPDATLQ